ncbi:MAG: DUF29 domain-containing protein [Stellaceae bacterium]
MTDAKRLYDEDFVLWAEQQAAALRAAAQGASNLELDWENLAEEIDSLGTSQRSALRSQIRRIIRHLIKLEYSLAQDPRRGWRESVNDAREEIRDLLEDSPSLRTTISELLPGQLARGIEQAINDLKEYQEVASMDLPRLRATTYTEEQVLGDWFPPEPARGSGAAVS